MTVQCRHGHLQVQVSTITITTPLTHPHWSHWGIPRDVDPTVRVCHCCMFVAVGPWTGGSCRGYACVVLPRFRRRSSESSGPRHGAIEMGGLGSGPMGIPDLRSQRTMWRMRLRLRLCPAHRRWHVMASQTRLLDLWPPAYRHPSHRQTAGPWYCVLFHSAQLATRGRAQNT